MGERVDHILQIISAAPGWRVVEFWLYEEKGESKLRVVEFQVPCFALVVTDYDDGPEQSVVPMAQDEGGALSMYPRSRDTKRKLVSPSDKLDSFVEDAVSYAQEVCRNRGDASPIFVECPDGATLTVWGKGAAR